LDKITQLFYVSTYKELKLAVLIDADNVPYSNVKGMMEEITKFGTPTTKRIYADWTRPNANGWKGFFLSTLSLLSNNTVILLVKLIRLALIDAMDLLYTGKLSTVLYCFK
jgi:hypothetical protein